MKKLMEQILKFGVVGAFCFLIDFAITNIVAFICRTPFGMTTAGSALVGGFWGFTISVIINYLLSMKYVFVRKESMDRKKEFIIFTVLSLFGLLLNEVIIYGCIHLLYENSRQMQQLIGPTGATAMSKVVATGIVMVYNFVTRKLFLEKKQCVNVSSEDNEKKGTRRTLCKRK